MKLYLKYIGMHMRTQLIHRSSFILTCIAQFFVPFSVFAGMYLLFRRFGHLAGWSLYEVGLCYGVTHTAFALAECIARGFDNFSSLIRNGDFDRIMVRPLSPFFQVLGSRFEFSRIGRLFQSFFVLGFSIAHLDISFSFLKVLALILMILSGIIIFSSIFMLGATLCFWTVEGLEVINIFTDGGREIAQYPLIIYKDWFRRFFTFVIPFGAFNYLPLLFVLGKMKNPSPLYAFVPLLGMLFFIPCYQIWRFGIGKYTSTGS